MTTRRGPRRRNRPDRERDLLDRLEEIFRTDGFADLTIADLANRMRCSKSAFYHLAPSKERLVVTVLERTFRRAVERATAAADRETCAVARLEAWLTVSAEHALPASSRVLADIRSYPPAREVYDRYRRGSMRVLEGLVDDGIRSGAFHPVSPQLVAGIFDAALDRVAEPEMLERAGYSGSAAAAELIRLVVAGIRRAGGAQEEPRAGGAQEEQGAGGARGCQSRFAATTES